MNGRFLAAAGVALGLAALWLWLPGAANSRSDALAGRERAMQMLGAHIAASRPNSKVLVLGNPFTKESSYLGPSRQYQRSGLRGLRAGLGRGVQVDLVFPEIRPEYLANPQSVLVPPDCRTPLSFVILPASLDHLAEARSDCGVIVSLIGLPVGVDRLKIWNEQDPRCFALLLPDFRPLGSAADVARAFECGKLLAAVVDDPASGKPLLVTRDNLKDILQGAPRLLGY